MTRPATQRQRILRAVAPGHGRGVIEQLVEELRHVARLVTVGDALNAPQPRIQLDEQLLVHGVRA